MSADDLTAKSFSLMDNLTFKAGDDRVVWLADALIAVALKDTELDGLYQSLADVSRAIARHLPTGDDHYPSITAAIKAVHEHGFAMGAAHAAAQIADALGDDGHSAAVLDHEQVAETINGEYVALDSAEHIGPCEETTS